MALFTFDTDRFAAVGFWLVCLATLITPAAAGWHNPFERFYPKYDQGLQQIIRDNCTSTYAAFVDNRHNVSAIEPSLRIFGSDTLTLQLIDCILANTPEVIKSKFAAAAIVLGLTPTIVATLGLRPHDTAVLSVVGRRHVLAFCLGVGSPALNAYRMSEFNSVIEDLRERTHRRPRLVRKFDHIITAVLYLAVAGAVANMGELTYRLGAQALFTVLSDKPYLALLWAFLGVAIHIFATLAMHMRLSTEFVPGQRHGAESGVTSMIKDQLDLANRRSHIVYTVKPESFLFTIFSIFITIFTATHIIFGTLVFSSITFIGINDAILIVARLMISAIICRVVAQLELTAMRESIREKQESGHTVAPIMSFNLNEMGKQPHGTFPPSHYPNHGPSITQTAYGQHGGPYQPQDQNTAYTSQSQYNQYSQPAPHVSYAPQGHQDQYDPYNYAGAQESNGMEKIGAHVS